MESKEEVIDRIYHDLGGHGSMKKTYTQSHGVDKRITEANVKTWFYNNIPRKTDLAGYNSFIAKKPKQEYQMDLMFLKDPEYEGGLLMVDAFTKYATIIPMKRHNAPALLEAIQKGMRAMGGKPETLYSDEEGGLYTELVRNYLAGEHIRLLTTKSHAGLAERTIRTLKDMIYKRIESTKRRDDVNKRWVDVLYPVLLTYNRVDKHSTIKMTPNEATKPHNHLQVNINLQLKRVHSRVYPDIQVGDYVRIRKKKDKLDKERLAPWSPEKHRIERTEESMGQTLYYGPLRPGEGLRPRALLRSDILKVS